MLKGSSISRILACSSGLFLATSSPARASIDGGHSAAPCWRVTQGQGETTTTTAFSVDGKHQTKTPPHSDKRVPVKEQSHHRATPNNGEEGTLCRVEPLPGTFGHGYSACVLIEYHAIRLRNIIQHHVLFKRFNYFDDLSNNNLWSLNETQLVSSLTWPYRSGHHQTVMKQSLQPLRASRKHPLPISFVKMTSLYRSSRRAECACACQKT